MIEAEFAAFVRSAFLLTGDRGHAEDLVQTALVKTHGAWTRLAVPAVAESYTRTTMVRLAARAARRRWRGEVPASHELVDVDRPTSITPPRSTCVACLPVCPGHNVPSSCCGSSTTSANRTLQPPWAAASEPSRAAPAGLSPPCASPGCWHQSARRPAMDDEQQMTKLLTRAADSAGEFIPRPVDELAARRARRVPLRPVLAVAATVAVVAGLGVGLGVVGASNDGTTQKAHHVVAAASGVSATQLKSYKLGVDPGRSDLDEEVARDPVDRQGAAGRRRQRQVGVV